MTPKPSPFRPDDRAPGSFCGRALLCVRGERVIFRDLSFDMPPGAALLLLGPNGSGKSSLLRLMALLLTPLKGSLTWGSDPVADDPQRHADRTRYVGHFDALKPVLTLRENLVFWSRLSGATGERVDEALEAFNLGRLANVPGRMLSAGQKRRANLARLIAAPAPLWLLDEPATALDKASVAILEERIAEHRAAGGMVALSTHQDLVVPDATTLRLDAFAARRKRPS